MRKDVMTGKVSKTGGGEWRGRGPVLYCRLCDVHVDASEREEHVESAGHRAKIEESLRGVDSRHGRRWETRRMKPVRGKKRIGR